MSALSVASSVHEDYSVEDTASVNSSMDGNENYGEAEDARKLYAYTRDQDPDVIRALADRIEELEKKLHLLEAPPKVGKCGRGTARKRKRRRRHHRSRAVSDPFSVGANLKGRTRWERELYESMVAVPYASYGFSRLRPASEQRLRKSASNVPSNRTTRPKSAQVRSEPLGFNSTHPTSAPPVRSAPLRKAKYQYDYVSGHKIEPGAQWQMAAQARFLEVTRKQREKEVEQKQRVEKLLQSCTRPALPKGAPRPSFPNFRTEQSVRKFMIMANEGRIRDGKSPLPGFEAPRRVPDDFLLRWPDYSDLRDGARLLTVEYCHTCATHGVTTRHDETMYRSAAEGLCAALHEIFQDVDITIEARPTPMELIRRRTRIGALDVQIAVCHHGRLHMRMLHSKLATSRRPPTALRIASLARGFLRDFGDPPRDEQRSRSTVVAQSSTSHDEGVAIVEQERTSVNLVDAMEDHSSDRPRLEKSREEKRSETNREQVSESSTALKDAGHESPEVNMENPDIVGGATEEQASLSNEECCAEQLSFEQQAWAVAVMQRAVRRQLRRRRALSIENRKEKIKERLASRSPELGRRKQLEHIRTQQDMEEYVKRLHHHMTEVDLILKDDADAVNPAHDRVSEEPYLQEVDQMLEDAEDELELEDLVREDSNADENAPPLPLLLPRSSQASEEYSESFGDIEEPIVMANKEKAAEEAEEEVEEEKPSLVAKLEEPSLVADVQETVAAYTETPSALANVRETGVDFSWEGATGDDKQLENLSEVLEIDDDTADDEYEDDFSKDDD